MAGNTHITLKLRRVRVTIFAIVK